MTKILFVCHGNICRSPMAEFVMKDIVTRAGRGSEYEIASAATSSEELGNPVYPPVRKLLTAHGIDVSGKTARWLTPEDYAQYDLLIGMDEANIRNISRICGGDPEGKIRLLLAYTGENRPVSDPWYTRNFDCAYRDILAGCRALFKALDGAY